MFDGWLTAGEVGDRICTCVSNVWRLAKANPEFPRPYRLAAKKTRWKAAEVDAYVESRRVNRKEVPR